MVVSTGGLRLTNWFFLSLLKVKRVAEYVEYSDSIVRKLEDALRTSFRQGSLFLTRPEKKGSSGDIRITIQRGPSGREFVAGNGDGRDHWVMEIMADGDRGSGFWFGFFARFALVESRKSTLQDVSILVFQDIRGSLIPLFRAEWAQVAVLDPVSNHAQPHWHFTQSPSFIENTIRALMRSDPDEVREFAPEAEDGVFVGLADFGMFHFAMTSLWEERDQPPYLKRQFDSNQFPKWFRRLTDYIAGQISYLVSHMPTTGVSTIKEFVPVGIEAES